ncbi:PTS system N-acetylgalactosamine-specific EIIC component 1 [uncultured Clostridium sp.]|uniref:PTS galactosamine transporter subunit IIC n=1 Tax=uncultured Clostridium sp. TaxID=59620 RepID=UPI0008219C39|nr:PTS galactosamine transporter subunit IIC [uncultured Clostridium sp.]SCJ06565.1 PTS system N-acetylgalactosamine-specific EIIC component 1 [uncultured Clostridium sp.]
MQEITLVQGLLLAIMAIIVGIDAFLEGLFIFRPIIVCTLTGAILGDLQLGLIAGGLTELAFAGLTPVGGTQPPNPVLAGVMTTVIAYTTGADVKTTIGLALPFSFLMQYIILFYYSSFSMFMQKLTKAAEEINLKKIMRINILSITIVGLTYGLVVFLCTYVAQEPMKALVESMPVWLSHGFEIAGGILPAIGFGLLLRIMLKKEYVAFLIIGFLVASFLDFSNLLPVALIGTALALFQYFNDQEQEKKMKQMISEASISGGEFDEGI